MLSMTFFFACRPLVDSEKLEWWKSPKEKAKEQMERDSVHAAAQQTVTL